MDWSSDLQYLLHSRPPVQYRSSVKSFHGSDYHKYADDTESADSAPPSNFSSAQSNIKTDVDRKGTGIA